MYIFFRTYRIVESIVRFRSFSFALQSTRIVCFRIIPTKLILISVYPPGGTKSGLRDGKTKFLDVFKGAFKTRSLLLMPLKGVKQNFQHFFSPKGIKNWKKRMPRIRVSYEPGQIIQVSLGLAGSPPTAARSRAYVASNSDFFFPFFCIWIPNFYK